MGFAVGNIGRSFGATAEAPASVAAPTLSLVRASATSMTATIDGPDGATHTVKYMQSSESTWTDGGSRSGDGAITVADLTTGSTYIAVATATVGGVVSLPSAAAVVTLTADADDGTPTERLSLPLYYLRETLAASATFRTWVGATTGTVEENLAAARAKIYYVDTDSPDESVFALVSWSDGHEATFAAGGARNHFTPGGRLYLMFQADIADGDDTQTAAFKFRNAVGAIMGEMETRAGTGGYLNITGWRITDEQALAAPHARKANDTAADRWLIELELEWS